MKASFVERTVRVVSRPPRQLRVKRVDNDLARDCHFFYATRVLYIQYFTVVIAVIATRISPLCKLLDDGRVGPSHYNACTACLCVYKC